MFNCHFQSVFSKPDNDCDTTPATDQSGGLSISSEGVVELLLRLNAKKSTGPDKIPAIFLKRYVQLIGRFLLIIFNKSLETGKVPTDWLLARVFPVLKKGSPVEISNYRPISLTCISCQVLEHISVKYLNNFLDKHSIIHNAQHGFRRGFSTNTQLVATINEFANVLDMNGQVDIIFLDFSKAFDRVSHNKLILTMKTIGISPEIINWVIYILFD